MSHISKSIHLLAIYRNSVHNTDLTQLCSVVIYGTPPGGISALFKHINIKLLQNAFTDLDDLLILIVALYITSPHT
jgi:hypothetical protein